MNHQFIANRLHQAFAISTSMVAGSRPPALSHRAGNGRLRDEFKLLANQ